MQFLLAGLLLFVGYDWIQGDSGPSDPIGRIEITADDLRQIQIAWLAQGRRAPTTEELRHLVDARVREEILYREALALGLDEDDTIVRRRMAQKLEFLFEDVAALREPTSDELRAWFDENSERFTLPARASFRHLYFSPDRRGERARDDAAEALSRLADDPADGSAAMPGDPFMFQEYYGDLSFGGVAKAFGPGFAEALFELAPGVWTGPVESGYGWHLVWVDSISPARVPALEEVLPDVRTQWIEARRDEVRQTAFDAMRARYEVILPENLEAADPASLLATEFHDPDEPR